MPTHAGPNTFGEETLVFGYDLADTVNSYVGEPTTNTMRQSNNVTGTQYGYNNEYDTCQLVKTWNASLKTPVGTGATLLTDRNIGNSPWYGLNWFDDSEDGTRCLSAYIYPVNSVTQLRIGMVGDSSNSVFFNLDTREITYGAGISNTNAFIQDVPGYPGWLRIGANIEGRGGGWIAFLGTGFDTHYTPHSPFQSFYVCGIQYERNIASHCTQFTPAGTTRSATQGLLPLVGNSTIDLTSVSFDSTAQMVFDGTDDSMVVSNNSALKNNNTSIELVIKYLNTPNGDIIQFGVGSGTYAQYYYRAYSGYSFWNWYPVGTGYGEIAIPNAALPLNQYHHIVMTGDDQGYVQFYINGIAQTGATRTSNTQPSNWTPADLTLGGFSWDGYSSSVIPLVKIYNKVLTASEISRNFNAIKSRFNI